MSSHKRAHAWAATLVVSFANVGRVVAQEEAAPAEAPPAEQKPPAGAPKPEDKPKPKPKPKASVAPPPAPALKPAPADEATRLRRVEAALRSAGLLEDGKKKELLELKDQLSKVDEQKKSLDAAIRGGLDAESVKPALLGLSKKEAEIKEKIRMLEAEQPAVSEAALKSPLSDRLEALEASVAALQKQPAAAAPANPLAAEPSTATGEEPAHPVAHDAKAKKDDRKPTGRAGWKDGFFIESEDGSYSLKPSGFLDFKFSYLAQHGEDAEFAFSVPYARLALKGNLFSKSLKYNVTTDFGKGSAVLTYFFGDYSIAADYFAVRAGQQKRPFSRLYIGPSEKSQFINSSSAVKAFGDATDLGVVLHNGQPRFEYALGLFNGQGSKSVLSGDVVVDPMTGEGEVTSGAFSNVPARFQPGLVTRVAYNHGKIEGYSEADFEGGPLRASLGAAGYVAFDMDRDDKSAVRGTVDGLIKVEGLAINAAGFIASRQKGDEFGEREREATGLVVQAGYLVTQHVEPVARYSFVARPQERADNDAHELTGGLNIYFYKHSLKWMNDLAAKVSPRADETTTDYVYESQLQLMF